jgi:hypothetical protein
VILNVYLTYAPLVVCGIAGVLFAARTKERLERLEFERSEARQQSAMLHDLVKDIAFKVSVNEQEVMGLVRGLMAKKAQGTPISDEELHRAADIVAQHQEAIEELLGE